MTTTLAAPPPARFNMAAYCLAPGTPRDPAKTGLVLVADADAPEAGAQLSFAALDVAVRGVAAGLAAAGLARGERLVIALPNTVDYLLLFYGAIAAGIVPLPASSMLTASEVGFLVADAGAAAVALADEAEVAIPEGVLVLRSAEIAAVRATAPRDDYADTAADDPAFLIYTSGTTRKPKGVLHAHRSAWGRRPTYAGWSGIGADDVMLHAGAFNWSYTLSAGLADPWANGATAVLFHGARDAGVWARLIVGTRATLFAAVPGVYRQMLRDGAIASGTGRLRHGLVAGEALSPALLDEWRAATGLALYEAFGMSECSTFVSNRPGMAIRPGSPGRPQPGRRIVALALDGGAEPVPTGEPGLLAVHRSDPGLAALVGCAGIAEVAVAEHEVRAGVRIIAAWATTAPGVVGDAALARALLARGAKTHAAYKQPREVFFVDALPRTPNGKVARRLLGTLAAAPALGSRQG